MHVKVLPIHRAALRRKIPTGNNIEIVEIGICSEKRWNYSL